MNPEAQLPLVYQTAANLYQAELFSLQLQGGRVRDTHYLHTHTSTYVVVYLYICNLDYMWFHMHTLAHIHKHTAMG